VITRRTRRRLDDALGFIVLTVAIAAFPIYLLWRFTA
jgi:hypothetical protein